MTKSPKLSGSDRQTLQQAGFSSIVLGGASGITTSPVWSKVAEAQAEANDRILVIVELSGGNDGLNTVIPYADDAYYNARPHLGIRDGKLLKIDEHFGFQQTMTGFERLYKDGMMGIVVVRNGTGQAAGSAPRPQPPENNSDELYDRQASPTPQEPADRATDDRGPPPPPTSSEDY